MSKSLIPYIRFTKRTVIFHKSSIPMLSRMLAVQSRTVGTGHGGEMLRRQLNALSGSDTKGGHFVRAYDIDGSRAAMVSLLKWANERIRTAPYSLETYIEDMGECLGTRAFLDANF